MDDDDLRIACILVGVDGSEPSLRAGRYALGLALRFGAALVALHVPALPASGPSFDPLGQRALSQERAARRHGELVLEQVRSVVAGRVQCETLLRFGEPSDLLLQVAEEFAADLIVVGSRGLGALDRLILGSVSSAVVQNARRPVLVVRPSAEP